MRLAPPTREQRPAGSSGRGAALLGLAPALALSIAVAVPVAVPAATAQSTPAANTARAPGCSMKGSKTIKANRHARVFKKVNRHNYGKAYGCLRGAKRAFELGIIGECQNNEEIKLAEVAGRRALLGIFECSLYDGWWRVALVNLGTGRREFSSSPIGSPAPNETTFDGLERIVVASDGAAAWTGTRGGPPGTPTNVEVRRRMRGSASASILLDSGTDIDPDSLRKRGRTLSWTKAGARRTATF